MSEIPRHHWPDTGQSSDQSEAEYRSGYQSEGSIARSLANILKPVSRTIKTFVHECKAGLREPFIGGVLWIVWRVLAGTCWDITNPELWSSQKDNWEYKGILLYALQFWIPGIFAGWPDIVRVIDWEIGKLWFFKSTLCHSAWLGVSVTSCVTQSQLRQIPDTF